MFSVSHRMKENPFNQRIIVILLEVSFSRKRENIITNLTVIICVFCSSHNFSFLKIMQSKFKSISFCFILQVSSSMILFLIQPSSIFLAQRCIVWLRHDDTRTRVVQKGVGSLTFLYSKYTPILPCYPILGSPHPSVIRCYAINNNNYIRRLR